MPWFWTFCRWGIPACSFRLNSCSTPYFRLLVMICTIFYILFARLMCIYIIWKTKQMDIAKILALHLYLLYRNQIWHRKSCKYFQVSKTFQLSVIAIKAFTLRYFEPYHCKFMSRSKLLNDSLERLNSM